MNKFDERYEIRLATRQDIESIMKFIDNYWRKGHILACDRTLFEYEYADGEKVNFVIAIERTTGLLEGIFGFLHCSRTTDLSKKDIWGSLWKVVDTHHNLPFLGIELAKRVFTLTGCRSQIGNGANPATTVPLRKMFFGEKVVKMKQYYILNSDVQDYKIAVIKDRGNSAFRVSPRKVKLVHLKSMDDVKKHFDIETIEAIPYKDEWYINKRYFLHPYYNYSVYGLQELGGGIGALMMTRSLTCNGAKVIRIVDYIGNQELFSRAGQELNVLIKKQGYEYMDFYTHGFYEPYIIHAGFRLRTDDDCNIIPNYFEPFVCDNADIWAHYKLDGTLFFKADGDQDRPNIISGNKILN